MDLIDRLTRLGYPAGRGTEVSLSGGSLGMATVADAGTCEPAASGNAASVRDKSLVTFLYLPF